MYGTTIFPISEDDFLELMDDLIPFSPSTLTNKRCTKAGLGRLDQPKDSESILLYEGKTQSWASVSPKICYKTFLAQ